MSGSLSNPLDVRILLIMLMNVQTNPPSKEERLKFAFNIIDKEESRMITFEDLCRILQANYFAGTLKEVEPKA
jgi:Ca2+-binding EF-hand superfamily protein